jgi:transposase InsO family protein
MNTVIEQHVKECHTCQETKSQTKQNKKKGNNYIMVIIDHFTRWMELYALKRMEAIEVAEKSLEFTCRHGSLLKILSDQGTNYQSELLNELYEILDIEKLRTTPYHPECDGLSERSNRTNEMALTMLVNEGMDNWDELLPQIQLAYNSSVNKTTNCSPFELM